MIIVNDGSTDDTEKTILSLIEDHPNIRYIKQSNKGIASARNLGISMAKGDIIGITDDDCVVESSWIEHAAGSLKNPEFCGVRGIILPEMKTKKKKKIFEYEHIAKSTGKEKYPSYPTGNIFYRRKHLIESSGFDENLKFGSDDDLAFRLIKKGYKIQLNTNMIVYHEIQYNSMVKEVSKRARRFEYLPLLVKKNPEYRDRFFLKIFLPRHIYPAFSMATIIMFLLNVNIYIPLFLTVYAFLATRVFVDKNYISMPKRIMFSFKYFLMDFAGFYYALKGSIKYMNLVI